MDRAAPSSEIQATPSGMTRRLPRPHAVAGCLGPSAVVVETISSIADEIVEELTATLLGNEASRNWLDRSEPDIAEARAAIESSVASARRAAELIKRLRRLAAASHPAHSVR